MEKFSTKIFIFLSLLVYMVSITTFYSRLSSNLIIFTLIISLYLVAKTKYLFGKELIDKNHSKIILTSLFFCFIPYIVLINLPPLSWDEIAYSASLPKFYADNMSIRYNADYGPYSAFPQNYEILTTLSEIFFHTTILSKLVNLLSIVAITTTIYSLAILSGSKKNIALLLSLITVLTSWAILNSTLIVKNDLFNCAIQSLTILTLIKYFKKRNLKYLALLGLLQGVSLGTKYTSILFVISVSIVLFSYEFVLNKHKKNAALRILFYSIVLIVFGFPWYLRNFLDFQNPLYPAFNNYFCCNNFNNTYISILNENTKALTGHSFLSGDIFDFIKTFWKINQLIFIVGISGLFFLYLKKTIQITLSVNKPINQITFLFFVFTSFVYFFGFWELRYYLVLEVILAVYASLWVSTLNLNLVEKKIYLVLKIVVFMSFIMVCSKKYNLIHDNLFKTNEEILYKNYSDYKVIDYVTKEIKNTDKIAFANIQPFYYTKNPYYHIHFLNELGNLSEKINEDSSFIEFINSQKINYFVIRFNLDDKDFPRPKAPYLNNWNDQLYNRFTSLEKKGYIRSIRFFREENVVIYELLK
jgi:hypothetical protein